MTVLLAVSAAALLGTVAACLRCVGTLASRRRVLASSIDAASGCAPAPGAPTVAE